MPFKRRSRTVQRLLTLTVAAVVAAVGSVVMTDAPAQAAPPPHSLLNMWLNACLDVDITDPPEGGSRVQTWDCNGAPQQSWVFEQVDGEWGQLRSFYGHRQCLDKNIARDIGNATPVQVWSCNGWWNQQWRIVVRNWDPLHISLVNRHDNRCLDAHRGGPRVGANVQVWDCNLSDQQRWYSTV